jgi:CheY-like chemotaxis protein
VVNLTFSEEGFDVVAVGDGDAAIREIANSRPDIVLADVHMPGPSGYEICSLLRGIEETAKTPVILLVGSFEQFDPEEAERAGADAFVTKPFSSIRQVVEQVKELVTGQSTAAADVSAEEVTADPMPPEKDTRDIDSLYEQSFSETVEMPSAIENVGATATFESDNLDDEITETIYGVEPEAELKDDRNRDGEAYAEAAGDFVGNLDRPTPSTREVAETDSSAYEETLQMDVPAHFSRNAQEPGSVHTAPTEELRRDPFATTTDAFDLDDIDLLDLTDSAVNEEITLTTPAEAVRQGSNKRVVSLSPELMDIIVKKVVEKLSEKY